MQGEFAKLEESGGRSETEPRIRLTILDLCMMLQLQDEAITADMQRLQATESNVKLVGSCSSTSMFQYFVSRFGCK